MYKTNSRRIFSTILYNIRFGFVDVENPSVRLKKNTVDFQIHYIY